MLEYVRKLKFCCNMPMHEILFIKWRKWFWQPIFKHLRLPIYWSWIVCDLVMDSKGKINWFEKTWKTYNGYEPEDGFEELGHFHFRFVPHRRTEVNQRCSVVAAETAKQQKTGTRLRFWIHNQGCRAKSIHVYWMILIGRITLILVQFLFLWSIYMHFYLVSAYFIWNLLFEICVIVLCSINFFSK